ncbi:MAG: M3 family oligoendopeptidase, partial [Bacilli bacterium]
MEELKNRTDIASDYKWNLNAMFLNEELYDQEVRLVVAASNRVLEYKNKIMNSSENLYQFYLDYEKFSRLQDKVYMYARLLFDSDTTNVVSQTRKMKLDKLFEQIQAKLSFISPEMLSVSYDLVLDFIKENKKLAKFTFDLEQLFKYRNHILSKEGELLLTKATNVMGTGAQVFNCLDNTDINLGTIIDENGDSVIVTNSNYSVYMKSKDRRVRKDAFNNMYTYWKSIKNTVATTLKGTIKECSFVSEVHKFDSKLKESLFADDIDISVYENLIKTVHLNVDKIDDYMILRKKILQLDSLHMYDIYVPLANSVVKNISFDSAKNIIFNALKPLGEVYLRDLEKAFSEKWIDIYPSIGKKSGAYSFGCYDSYPYLLINYENDINSVSTLAHELGHSMHSYYSNSNQDYTYHSYPIFLAEIASTVNEMLINEYLYNQAKTKEEKIFYLTEFLDKIRTTICRQTMF